MTPLVEVEARSMRRVLVATVALLAFWAVALVRQAERYVPASLPPPPCDDIDRRRQKVVGDAGESLLARFYRALDVKVLALDPTGAEPIEPDAVVVLVHTQAQAPRRLEDSLVAHVRQGGRLVIFAQGEVDLLSRLGLGVGRFSSWTLTSPALACEAAVDDAFVGTTTGFAALSVRTTQRPVVPLLIHGRDVLAGLAGVGRGCVVVVTAPLADPALIDREDNPIFLANLILGGPRPTPRSSARWARAGRRSLEASLAQTSAIAPIVRIADLTPTVLMELHTLDAEPAERAAQARREWTYDSLWALIQANPVSAALLQIALGLLVFGIARARRLGPPLPECIGHSELPGALAAQAARWERHDAAALALKHTLAHALRRLRALLGLGPDATDQETAAALSARSSRLGRDFEPFWNELRRTPGGDGLRDARILTLLWNFVDRFEKELSRDREGA